MVECAPQKNRVSDWYRQIQEIAPLRGASRCFLFAFFVAGLLGACSQEQEIATTEALPKKEEVILDTTQGRYSMALKVVEAYPTAEFGGDVLARLKRQVGNELAEEVRSAVRDRMSEKEVLELRIKLLTGTFTAPQLAKMAELYRDPVARDFLRKLPQFEEEVRDAIQPMVAAVLSGERR